MESSSQSRDDSSSSDAASRRDGSVVSGRGRSMGRSAFVTPVKGGHEFRQRKVSSRRFEDETMKRFEEYEKKKKDKLLVQKKEIMKSEMMEYTLTPKINKQGGRCRKEKVRNPFVSRLDEILESRKIKIESKKDRFLSKEEMEARECTFRPSIGRKR